MTEDPERLILNCRVQAIYLENGEPWPWDARKRQLFKALLRTWGLVIESHKEEPQEPQAGV